MKNIGTIIGKIGIEIIKMYVMWFIVADPVYDILTDDLGLVEGLGTIIIVSVITVYGYFRVSNIIKSFNELKKNIDKKEE